MTFSPYANHQKFRLAAFEAMPAFAEANYRQRENVVRYSLLSASGTVHW